MIVNDTVAELAEGEMCVWNIGKREPENRKKKRKKRKKRKGKKKGK